MIQTDIKESRFHGLSEQLDMLLWKFHDTGMLSKLQRKQMVECADTIRCFGELGESYYNEVQNVLSKLSYGKD